MEERWYAHAVRRSLLVHEIDLTAPAGSATTVELHASPSKLPRVDVELIDIPPGGRHDLYAVVGQNVVPEVANATSVAIAANAPCTPSNDEHACAVNISLAPGETRTLVFITAVVSSLYSADPATDAVTELTEAAAVAKVLPKGLLDEHTKAWKARHRRGSISIVGDLRLARAINASLYSLRSSIRDEVHHGLSPGGLTTNGYNGHTFWDQETWMVPPLIMLDPPSARSALAYRAERHDAAAALARPLACNASDAAPAYCPVGYQRPEGALRFPWESAFTGTEVQYSDGKTGPWGRYESHVSSDVALAMRDYYYASADTKWLASVGYPIIRGVAAFLSARCAVTRKMPSAAGATLPDVAGKAAADAAPMTCENVMGPDEYAYPVNGSAYTDAAAAEVLRAAAELAKAAGAPAAPPKWAELAKALAPRAAPVPQDTGLHGLFIPEYDGYPGLKGPKVKQADTVMLRYPIGAPMDEKLVANNFKYYAAHTDAEGPAMTWQIFALGWMTLHNHSAASAFFQKGHVDNVRPPFFVWRETLSGGCTPFLTGAGGFLQSVLNGVGGVRLEANALALTPSPPLVTGGNATQVSFESLNWRGATLRIEIDVAKVKVSQLTEGRHPLALKGHRGETHPLAVGGAPLELSRGGTVRLIEHSVA